MAEHDGDADAALAALPSIAAKAGVSKYTPCPPHLVDRELAAGRHAGAVPVFFGEAAYPVALAELPDAPPMLWALGDVSLAARPAVAMVGARNASSLGLRAARAFAQGLGQAGLVVVSGLARGIDAVAHDATVDTGTIAVVAGGVDIVYPRENAELTTRIAASGLILSEMPPGLQPQARHFPRRNRIISGLSRAVLVVEAAARSGSLITARDALDQGRDVLAVPGHPFDARASGCNMLIRDGATLVRGPEDVLEALGSLDLSVRAPSRPARSRRKSAPPQAPHPIAKPTPPTSGEASPSIRQRILTLLGAAPIAEDQLIRDLALPGPSIANDLLELEMEGCITRQPGGLLSRTASPDGR